MEVQQYIVKDFELFTTRQSEGLLYTPELSAHVTHAKVFALLEVLKIQISKTMDENALDALISSFALDCAIIKKYLVRSLKILILKDAAQFKKLFLMIEDDFIREQLQNYFKESNYINVYVGSDFSAVDDDSLIMSFRSHYLPQSFEDVIALAAERDAWLMTAYIANEYLIMDNIYNAKRGVPCHFCNYYRHQNIVLSSNALKKTSWINFCRKAMEEEVVFFPAIPMTVIEKCGVVFWLVRTIGNFVGYASSRLFVNEALQYSWVNLLTGEKNQDQAVHWSFCECLQRECA